MMGCDNDQQSSQTDMKPESILSKAQSAADNMADVVQTQVDDVKEVVQTQVDDVKDVVQAQVDDVKDVAITQVEEIKDELKDVVTEPVAEVVAAAEKIVAKTKSGEQVYMASCQSCHASGAANSPKFADKAAWQPRIAKGVDALYASALNGVPGTAMMPKGTCAACSEEELKAAVDYIIEKSQ